MNTSLAPYALGALYPVFTVLCGIATYSPPTLMSPLEAPSELHVKENRDVSCWHEELGNCKYKSIHNAYPGGRMLGFSAVLPVILAEYSGCQVVH